MSILRFLVYIYLLLRPYYIFHSGNMQVSDIVLSIGFIVFILITSKDRNVLRKTISDNKHYLIFILFVIAINLIYYLVYLDFSFVLSTLHYIFNLFVILVFSYLIKDDGFFSKIEKIVKINIFIQLILYLTGLGSAWLGTTRYMGTFNDPNQFAYFMLISYCYLFLLKQKLKSSTNLFIYFVVSFYLILRSSSTGMLLGIILMALLSVVDVSRFMFSFLRKNSKKILLVLYCILTVFLVIMLVIRIKPEYGDKIYNSFTDIKIFNRVQEKIAKSNNDSGKDLWHDRGYDIVFSYPKYIVYGAGQGKYNRFTELTGHTGEIHATLPSILFYYGIIPTLVLIAWIYKKLKGVPFKILIVYIALFVESFTLLNQRQALFWIIIILGSTFRSEKNEKG